jgi:hypothetical protein
MRRGVQFVFRLARDAKRYSKNSRNQSVETATRVALLHPLTRLKVASAIPALQNRTMPMTRLSFKVRIDR